MEKICKNCQYYTQHYIRWGRGYTKISCGHCREPRLKNRKPETLACVYYKEKKKE